MSAPEPPGEPERQPASDFYPALVRAVEAADRRHSRIDDPLARTVAYSELVAALLEQLALVTAERDAAVIEVLAAPGRPSNRALSREFHLSRQRVDQLAAIARRGGRPRRLT